MPLVHMVGADIEAGSAQGSEAADAQDYLLLQTVRFVASVEPIGDLTVHRVVFGELRVEQDHRDLCPCGPLQNIEPGAHPNLTSLDSHRNFRLQRDSPPLRVPGIGVIHLRPL